MQNGMQPKKLIFTICLFSFQTYGCAARTNHKAYPENFKLWACPPPMGIGVSGEHPVRYLFFGPEENDDPNNPASNAVDRDSTTKMVSEWLGPRNWVTACARKRTTWILGAWFWKGFEKVLNFWLVFCLQNGFHGWCAVPKKNQIYVVGINDSEKAIQIEKMTKNNYSKNGLYYARILIISWCISLGKAWLHFIVSVKANKKNGFLQACFWQPKDSSTLNNWTDQTPHM